MIRFSLIPLLITRIQSCFFTFFLEPNLTYKKSFHSSGSNSIILYHDFSPFLLSGNTFVDITFGGFICLKKAYAIALLHPYSILILIECIVKDTCELVKNVAYPH